MREMPNAHSPAPTIGKRAGNDKRLHRQIEKALTAELEHVSPVANSPLGPLKNQSTHNLLISLITTMNARSARQFPRRRDTPRSHAAVTRHVLTPPWHAHLHKMNAPHPPCTVSLTTTSVTCGRTSSSGNRTTKR